MDGEIQIDDVLVIVGGFGPFQWICIFAFCIMTIPSTFQVLIMYFLSLKPTWRCVSNSTVCQANGTFESGDKFRCSIPRTEWEFTEPREFSIVTQFDIYCDEEWLLDLATGIFFIGAAIGGIIFGTLADRRGRKCVLFTCLTLLLVTALGSAFSPNIYVFIAFRLLAGSFFAGSLAMVIIMVAELVEANRRPLAANIVWIFYSAAFCILTLKAYYIRNWKTLLIVCTGPYFFVVSFYMIIPESIRWLLLRQQKDEVETIFARMAKRNNRSYSPLSTTKPETRATTTENETYCVNERIKSGYLDLCIPLSVAVQTVIQAYSWYGNSMVYYGLSLASGELGGSIYLNFALISIMECPGHLACAYLSNRFGRKKTAMIPLLLASIACIIIPFIPVTGYFAIARVIFGMLGKCFITTCYDTCYLWSTEIFPTNNRAKGIGLLQVFEMLGGACAPFIAKRLELVNVKAPFIVFGVSSLLGAGLMTLLPETKGASMDEVD